MKVPERKKVFIGIDPGKSGAVAVLYEGSPNVNVFDYPGNDVECAYLIRKLLVCSHITLATVEVQQAMPGQGVTSMFSIGRNYGAWLGILAAFSVPVVLVRPQAWKKGIIPPKADKKASVTCAARMFPTAELFGSRGGAKDGRADALLIADWGMNRRNEKS